MKTAAAVKSRAMVSELDKIAAAEARISREAAKAARGPTGNVRGGYTGGRNTAYMGGQLAMQAQDVAVMAQMGMSTTRIIAQQGSQILSILGPHGAIAGGVLAIGAAILSWALGTEKAEKAAKEYAANLEAIKKLAGEIGDASKQHGQALAIARTGFEQGDDAAAQFAEELRFRNLLAEAEGRLAKAKAANKRSFEPEMGAAAARMVKAQLQGNAEEEKKAVQELADLRRAAAIDNFAMENEAQRDILKLQELRNISMANLDRAAAKRKEDANAQAWEAQRKWEESAFEAHQRTIAREEADAKEQQRIADDITRQEIEDIRHLDELKEAAHREERARQAEIMSWAQQREWENQQFANQQKGRDDTVLRGGRKAYDELKESTFGKSSLDKQRERNAARRAEREEKKWRKKMDETGGLTGIRRGIGGEIESGIDPMTGKRVQAAEAGWKWRDAKRGKEAADKVQATIDKESMDALVAAIADLLPK